MMDYSEKSEPAAIHDAMRNRGAQAAHNGTEVCAGHAYVLLSRGTQCERLLAFNWQLQRLPCGCSVTLVEVWQSLMN